jgi:hypothetical protein
MIAKLVALFLIGSPAMADEINVQQAFARSLPNVAHIWGQKNVSTKSADMGVRIQYPKGSIDPGNSPPYPLGGAGFELRFLPRALSRTLTYNVKFESGFMFNKGGKLPGLFGGSNPRGCVQGAADGFSARLMWRTGGAGELYLYAPGRDTACGQSIGRGNWTFVQGDWYTVTERITMNVPGSRNGTIQVLINGMQVVEAGNLTLRNTGATGIDGLLFSTFFGGSDASWASPKDQWTEFRDFSVQ